MNQFLTTDWLSMKALRLLVNSLKVTSVFNTDWNSDYQKPFAPGEVVRIEYPPKWFIRDGIGYDPQPIQEIQSSVSCDQVFGVDFQWDDVEEALQLERDDTRQSNFYMKGPVAQIAQEWDLRSALFAYQYANQFVGVLGTNPTSFAAFGAIAEQKLFEQACPEDGDRDMIISPGMTTSLIGGATTVFNPQAEISKQFRKNEIGEQANFGYTKSMSLRTHTAGTWAAGNTLSASSVTGDSSIVIACTSGDTVKKGDKIGIASVYNANPMTRETTTTAYTFTVSATADVTASGATMTVPITPTIYGPGSPFQNVSALPAAGATLTLWPGTTLPNGKSGKVGLAIHRDAYAIVNVPLSLPKAVEIAKQQRDDETGMAIRFVRAWQADQSRYVNRFDTLGGYGILYNNNCVIAMVGA